jgi:hypothetical protein
MRSAAWATASTSRLHRGYTTNPPVPQARQCGRLFVDGMRQRLTTCSSTVPPEWSTNSCFSDAAVHLKLQPGTRLTRFRAWVRGRCPRWRFWCGRGLLRGGLGGWSLQEEGRYTDQVGGHGHAPPRARTHTHTRTCIHTRTHAHVHNGRDGASRFTSSGVTPQLGTRLRQQGPNLPSPLFFSVHAFAPRGWRNPHRSLTRRLKMWRPGSSSCSHTSALPQAQNNPLLVDNASRSASAKMIYYARHSHYTAQLTSGCLDHLHRATVN